LCPISFATFCNPSSLISNKPTFQPFFAKNIAVALPIPDAAPVINMFLFKVVLRLISKESSGLDFTDKRLNIIFQTL
jgi:hypothetical protein